MGMKKKIIIGLIGLLVVIQFFRIDKSRPETEPGIDFISLTNPPEDIKNILHTACYDCHSYESVYPWYSNIAPVSWWIKDHINDGRGHLNFSVWGEYEEKKKDHKLEEIVEEVKEGEMPLKSYLITHSEAKLDNAQRAQLTGWIESLRSKADIID